MSDPRGLMMHPREPGMVDFYVDGVGPAAYTWPDAQAFVLEASLVAALFAGAPVELWRERALARIDELVEAFHAPNGTAE